MSPKMHAVMKNSHIGNIALIGDIEEYAGWLPILL